MREIIRGLFKVNENVKEVVPDIYQDGINGLVLKNTKNEAWRFYKSHSAKELLNYQGNTVSNDLIIYIVRNPLDVFCSQLNYILREFDPSRGGIQLNCASIDEAKQNGLLDDFFSAFLVYGTLMPFFKDARSWMENTRFWIEKSQAGNKVIIIKYEDMINQFDIAMQPILERIGMDSSNLQAAMEMADTRTNDGGKFFWKKKDGTYREYLTTQQVNKFFSEHQNIVRMCGYEDYYKGN